jgi:hypothetical protein
MKQRAGRDGAATVSRPGDDNTDTTRYLGKYLHVGMCCRCSRTVL